MKKVLMVFGTRPEAIKMAPLYHTLKGNLLDFTTLACVTAQHRQMLDQVLHAFEIKPEIDLDLMRPGQDLFDITAQVLLGMRAVLKEHRPDILLVHGDTTTALAAATAAFYAGVPVGHVEAGLRTGDLSAPFPEEFNRQVVSKVSSWHFAPTQSSRENLLSEGTPSDRILVTGNTVIDALAWVLGRVDADSPRFNAITRLIGGRLGFPWQTERFVLITGHRRENFGHGLLEICNALRRLASMHPDTHFVYPIHLNPNVQVPVRSILSGLDNVHLIEPLEYEAFVLLLRQAYLVLTDSGGLQEEAPSLGKPVLVMREVTERPEAVDAGTVRLVGADCKRIVENAHELLIDSSSYAAMARAVNPYGDGRACERIVEALKKI
jgi:UDP-N-acetylglucosamine 2-epimerase (non-hydrolysing)